MQIENATIVVTGAASGIGRAMAHRFARDGAGAVVVADLNAEGAEDVASEISGVSAPLDVTDPGAVGALIDGVEADIGPIDLWCGNAGVGANGGVELADDVWNRTWDVNVMAHVIAARILVPRWIERGGGHLLLTASAAGLLTNLGTAPYAVTKHACVALAEWIAITHGEQGVGVSCLCPQGVRTPMTEADGELSVEVVKAMGMIEPEQVADAVAAGLAADEFLILPHPEVATYEQRRAGDRARWIAGMQRLQAGLTGTG
ncbi:MAG: SDR family oxidoreductase [Actinobacteria bacterium]|nr:SDR family oxidoreductase [Actinomycetota bacterium]NIS36763.1 SDR family oxidoreductase [Actinomycetota bacterium]NIT98902.1 SDR family oxidoreductase [Actinomycetota bacterium]NIU22541.1 SDR family oxidoreductase [Actinomycetota bacterium]NIU71248.1 SDR family oxidoreductase [Actinomycetota bacterium]